MVTYDRESCVLYKRALDRMLPAEMSDVVMTVNSGEGEYAACRRGKGAEERLLDRFRDANDPLEVLIVTSKLLTGFDAPDLQTMYLRQAVPRAAAGHLPHEPAVRRDQRRTG